MEECIFKTREVIEKVKPDIERILEFKSTPKTDDERRPFENLFNTPCGKRFGNQVEAAVEFALRGHALSTILPVIGKVSSVVSQGIARGDLDSLKTQESSPEDNLKIDALKTLTSDIPIPNPQEVEDLVYSKDDVLWFLSLVAFSLHTYLDVYTMCIIELVESHGDLNNSVELYLQNLSPSLTDKLGNPILKVVEVKRVGVFRRLVTIEEGLGVTSILDTVVESKELSDIRKACKKFNIIRGKIAHSNPRLKQEKYAFEEFEKDLDEPLLDFEDVKKEAGLPKYLDEVMDIIRPKIDDLSETMMRTALVVRMALTYPAILDVTLSALIS